MSARAPRRTYPMWLRTTVLVMLAACHSWRTQPVNPAELLATAPPPKVRLKLHDGRRIVVRQPALRADTIVSQAPNDPFALALGEVDSVAVRKGDGGKTTGLVLLIVGVPALLCAVACEPEIDFSLPND
jgi:hypothetical protein